MATTEGEEISQITDDVHRIDEPHHDLTLDDVDKLDLSKLPPQIRKQIDLKKIASLYRNTKSIRLLLTGKTGTGKSTLVNGILGVKVEGEEVAKEGKNISKACTTKVNEYTTNIAGIDVMVWDTPGLQDGTGNQPLYLGEMKEKCTPRDLTLYCINVTGVRFVRGTDNPDVVAIKKLTEAFGTDFWENAVIILTFANVLESFNPKWSLLPLKDKVKAFQGAIQEWREQIQEILILDAKVPKEIVDTIPVVPAGHYLQRALPDREYWLSALWFTCLHVIPSPEGKAALVKINVKRIKRENNVKEADFRKQPHEQPIVVSESKTLTLVLTTSIGSFAGGATGGFFGLLGFLAGPVGLVTVPVGILAGVLIGGGIGLGAGNL